MKRLATTDSLTGALNRGAFEKIYSREVEMCRRYGHPLSFLMVDIDNFKNINDTQGHAAGDTVLKNLVELLTESVRKVDSIFRYGGDEFVILLPNTSKEQAGEAKKRILQRLEYQNSLGTLIPYRVSIGLHAMGSEDDQSIFELLDMDLYREKDKKFSRTIENIEDHLEDMLKEERSKLRPEGKGRTS